MEQELITLGILFSFALVGGILASRFKQPILLGLLVVGAAIGPNMFGLVKNTNMIQMMIDFGAILMLFVIGLEFDMSKLKKIGLKAIIVGILKSALVVFIGFNVGLLLGLGVQASLFIGIILAFSSTVVIVKVLEQKQLMSREEVPLLIAVLIIEDLLAVTILTFFSGMRNKLIGMIGSVQNLVIAICALILIYIIFIKFIKPLIAWMLRTNTSEEIITFTALAMCTGFSYLAFYLHLSAAAGAFLAGSIVASLPEAKKFEHAIAPYNLMISSLFFIAIGTLININSIIANIWIIIALVITVIITRIFAFGLIVYLFANFKGDKMFFSSLAMFSVGEFSLLIAQESQQFNIGIDLMSISAAIVFITAVIMSLTLNYSDRLYEPTKDTIPYTIRRKFENFSNYIKTISEELDLEGRYSRGLKNNLFSALLLILVAMLTIFGWREVSSLIASHYSSSINMIAYIIILSIISALLFMFLIKSRRVIHSLSEIFSNTTITKSVIDSKKTVNQAFVGFSLVWIALLFPFVMFLFNLKPWTISVAFGLIVIAIWEFRQMSKYGEGSTASRESYPEFKRASFNAFTSKTAQKHEFHETDTRQLNQGWKF